MSTVLKPIFLDTDGYLSSLPNDSIVNIGGVSGSNFSVGGRGLLFDDGTSSIGGGITFSLQTVYALSTIGNSEAKIKLFTNKDFVIVDNDNDNIFFRVSANTGKVTITGDLEVLGSSTVINSVIQDVDHWLISPHNSGTVALSIEPDPGVTPIADLLSIRVTNGAAPVLRVTNVGNVQITTDVLIDGNINNVDLNELEIKVNSHINGTGQHHNARDINISPAINNLDAANVQDALILLNDKLNGHSGFAVGFEYSQPTGANIWTINHNKNSKRVTVAIYDNEWSQIMPDSVRVLDENTVLVTFIDLISGTAILNLF